MLNGSRRDADAEGIPAAADAGAARRQRRHPPAPAEGGVGLAHVHDTHYLRIFVRKLRQKIERDPTQPRILLTELGVGYRLAQSDLEGAWTAASEPAKTEP